MLIDIHHEYVDRNPMAKNILSRKKRNDGVEFLRLTTFDNVKQKMEE